MSNTSQTPSLQRVPNTSSSEQILAIIKADGGVIIENFMTLDQLQGLNNEIDAAVAEANFGSTHSDEFISKFHGAKTKRITNLVTISQTFRDTLLDSELVHVIAERAFWEESQSYWMSTAQVIEISPGNDAQPLHRDLENTHPFIAMGSTGPEVSLNFLIALSDFTEENGATRVIPGSNHWSDFNNRGTPEMTIPAEMKAGDVLLISGKVVHGGGANRSVDIKRRGLAFTFQPGYLTPEEAYPFLVQMELVKEMSPRAQKMIGFRSQYPKGSPGLWQIDYKEIGDYMGL
jgi:ectoine hydroxylase-related dioxygenase (phytanoyl-CoA dioxygenase family)